MAAVMAVAASGGLALGVIAAVQADAEAKVEDRIDLPIIMYHGLLKEEKRQGQFIISPNLFEQDLRYLQENGYTTVVIADLIAYVQEGKPLPEKPVMLTFDDGYYNNYLYAFPLLKQYNCKMVLSPIGRYTDEYTQNKDTHANYAHCSWDAVRNDGLRPGGIPEPLLQPAFHRQRTEGGQKKAVESLVDYRTLLVEDVMKMQTRMREETGYTPTAFVYPFGAVSSESLHPQGTRFPGHPDLRKPYQRHHPRSGMPVWARPLSPPGENRIGGLFQKNTAKGVVNVCRAFI